MIDLTKYHFDDDDIKFLLEIEDGCINGQSEIILEYNGHSFVLEPHGNAVQVYSYGAIMGKYVDFEDLLLNHKIDDKPLIELLSELEYGE